MPLPTDIVDCHHHFLAPDEPFHSFLKGKAPNYTAAQYAADCGDLPVSRTVHVEALAVDGAGEARYVEQLADGGMCKVAAIVANCDLSAPDAAAQLAALKKASPRLRGIRYILDYVGPWTGKNATHVACSVHDTDYLRDAAAAPKFAAGFAQLAALGLSFDLQCAPEQLPAAAKLCATHPEVRVVIDHLGKPRHLGADAAADAATLAEWRANMAAMAALPQVYVKLSMLGYCVPGWDQDAAKEATVAALVLEVIQLFGASRCMFASNWHVNGAVSNGPDDGPAPSGPAMPDLYAKFAKWVAELPADDQAKLFAGTAAEFYRI